MKKRPRKQSSARVSTIAAKLMSMLGKRRESRVMLYGLNSYGAEVAEADVTNWVRTLAASALSQDETPGQQGKRGRKR